MPISSVGRASNRGVTLIELMVVMSIVGLIVAVSAPSVGAGLDSVRLRTASSSIASFLNAAVNHAERRQQAVAVTISPKENRLTAFSNQPGFERELILPDGIAIEQPDAVLNLILLPG